MATGAATKLKTDLIADLQNDGQITIGDVSVRLNLRGGTRLVISFSAASVDGTWLSDSCEAEDFSQLSLSAKTPQAFQALELQTFLKNVAAHALCKDRAISLCGAGPACAPAIACGKLFRNPILVAFDPPPELDASDANARHFKAGHLFYDPLVTAKPALMASLKGARFHWLKAFAAQGDSVNAFWRMRLVHAILPPALNNELDAARYYGLIRARKDFYFYRVGIEAALTARGKPNRITSFRRAFRKRREDLSPTAQFAEHKARAEQNRPDRPGAWLRLGQKDAADQIWPSAGGNVWMLEASGTKLRYLSDRWHRVTMGYEERAGVTLAQTPHVALGCLGFGDGAQVERPLKRRFPWHVTDAQLDGNAPAFGPMSEATLLSERLHTTHEGLFTILALSQSQAGITAPEAERGARAYVAALDQVRAGQTALKDWGKSLFIDRIRLALLTGAPQTTEAAAATHYAQVAKALGEDIAQITEQHGAPFITVVPQAGSRHDGTSEVSLAEARFDLDNPTLNALVPTPAYPWPLMDGTPATHSPEAALLIDELCMIAISERQAGRPWHCPVLQFATVSGREVTAEFSTLDGFEIDKGPHGFHLIGDGTVPKITTVDILSDRQIKLQLDQDVSTEALQLAYAWGHQQASDNTDHSANHGALRDRWSQPSSALPDRTLYRFALPGRVPLQIRP